MNTRRSKAQRLADKRATLVAKMTAIQQALETVDSDLTPAQLEEQHDENLELGLIARMLIAENAALKERFVAKAGEMYRKPSKRRTAVQRVLGPLSVQVDNTPRQPEPEDLGDLVDTCGPVRPQGDNLDRLDAAE